MTKRNLDSAPLVGKNQKTERNIVQGGRGFKNPKKPPKQTVDSDPVSDWVPPNGGR